MSDFKRYLNTYEFSCVLPGSGKKVNFKPITPGQMKNLLVYEKEEDPMILENAMDDLIQSCIINESFDIKDQYIQDRFFLIVEIRKKSKGELYKFTIDCPKCKSQSLNTINLDKLNVVRLEIDKEKSNKVKLNNNITIELKHITRRDQNDSYEKTKPKENNLKSLTDFMLSTYANSIVKIITPEEEINEPSYDDRIFLLSNITTGEYEKITEWFEKNDFGVNFVYKMKCEHCELSKKMDISVSDFFF